MIFSRRFLFQPRIWLNTRICRRSVPETLKTDPLAISYLKRSPIPSQYLRGLVANSLRISKIGHYFWVLPAILKMFSKSFISNLLSSTVRKAETFLAFRQCEYF